MCAGTVVEPAGETSAGDRLDDLEIEIGGLQAQRRLLGPDQHVGEDRNGVAPLDHAMHVAQRLQQLCALDGDLHGSASDVKGRQTWRRLRRFLQGLSAPEPRFSLRFTGLARQAKGPRDGGPSAGVGGAAAYSCSCRFRTSISSASMASLPTSPSILRTACSTVVWSRPPNRRPISGSERKRQRLGQIHRHLPRAHHIGGAARRQQVGAADVVLARHDALDVLDLDALGLLRTDQVAHLALGHFHRHRLAGELVVREQAVERAFEIAAVVGDRFGDDRPAPAPERRSPDDSAAPPRRGS